LLAILVTSIVASGSIPFTSINHILSPKPGLTTGFFIGGERPKRTAENNHEEHEEREVKKF
jgi:hypothetical protein